ncbi:hypothetical protein [Nocardiopsis nanhaiensis]
MNAPNRVDPGVRQVLTAPRGQRFTRTRTGARAPARPPTREQRLLAQMADNPRVQYRREHGTLPHWMKVAAARRQQADRPPNHPDPPDPPTTPAPTTPPVPPTPPGPPTPRVPRPRPAPEQDPFPPRPRSHRKPRRTGWKLLAYTLAATTGAAAHHLTTLWW